MAIKLKMLLVATVAATTLGAGVAASVTPAQAFIGFPRYYGYYYGPGVGYAAGAVVGNAIAAGAYPYYGDPYADPYGYGPYQYPYPGYGYYYGY